MNPTALKLIGYGIALAAFVAAAFLPSQAEQLVSIARDVLLVAGGTSVGAVLFPRPGDATVSKS